MRRRQGGPGSTRLHASRPRASAGAPEGPAGERNHDQRDDERRQESAPVEDVVVTDPYEGGEDEPAEYRAREAEDDRHQPRPPTTHVLEGVVRDDRSGYRA